MEAHTALLACDGAARPGTEGKRGPRGEGHTGRLIARGVRLVVLL